MKKNLLLCILGIILGGISISIGDISILLRTILCFSAVILITFSLRHKMKRIVKKEIFIDFVTE